MRLALLAITACALQAQSFEVRGIVVELGSGVGLAGVEVSLARVVALRDAPDPGAPVTGYTDARGNFSLKPKTAGQYRIDAKKGGYTPSLTPDMRSLILLTADRPTQEFRLTLMSPSGVTGRFVDEQDKPIWGLHVVLQPIEGLTQLTPSGVTDVDGVFKLENVVPGPHLVRAVTNLLDVAKIVDFSEAEFQIVERDYENLYWPSGVADPRDALPLIVPSGGVANLGTIHLRREDRYRVRLNVAGDCSGAAWRFALQRQPIVDARFTASPLTCKEELLLIDVPPGSYEFALWSDGENIRWAREPLLVTRSNTSLSVTLSPGMDVPGRIVVSEGVKPPPSAGYILMMRPDINGISSMDAQEPQVLPDLTFVGLSLRWNRYRVSVPRVPAPYYVREIRYGGRPVTGGRIDLVPGSLLELELDDKPAVVTGRLTNGEQPITGRAVIALAKAPFDVPNFVESNAPFSYIASAVDGRFEMSGLAPGEYRIAAVVVDDVTKDLPRLEQIVRTGEKITLERGQQRTVELKISTIRR